MKNVENKEYHALLGLTKQERNDIIIIYETMRNKSARVSYKDAKNSFRAIREENEMEFSGVYHKTSEQMSYALDEDRLIVNIKTDGLVSVRGPVKRKRRMAADDV